VVQDDDVASRHDEDAREHALDGLCAKRVVQVEDEISAREPVREGVGTDEPEVATSPQRRIERCKVRERDGVERRRDLDADDLFERHERREHDDPPHTRSDVDERRPLRLDARRRYEALEVGERRRFVVRRKRDARPDGVRIEIPEKDERFGDDAVFGVEALPGSPSRPTASHSASLPEDRVETRSAERARRLFVAAELDGRTRERISRVAAKLRAGAGARLVPKENYHLTVAFLGAVTESRVSEVIEAVRSAAARCSPLRVTLDAVGAFPNGRRPRAAWVGSRRRSAEFAAVCLRVRESLSALGFAFAPHDDAHVTIARYERDAPPLPRIALRPDSIAVVHLTVFESVTARDGARYTALARVPLGDATSGLRSVVPQDLGQIDAADDAG
jgi:2'-5' RNA ligase